MTLKEGSNLDSEAFSDPLVGTDLGFHLENESEKFQNKQVTSSRLDVYKKTVMASGIRYTYPPEVYPRYRYYQHLLLGLIPRFRRIIDGGNFSKTISQGEKDFKMILEDAKCFQSKISVTVYSTQSLPSETLMKLKKGLVQNAHPINDKTTQEWQVSWQEWEDISQYQPQVIVYVRNSESTEAVKQKLQSSLSSTQQNNVIVYNLSSRRNDLYSSIIQPGALTFSGLNKALSKQIQHLLEGKIVGVLARISYFISKFEPKHRRHQDRSLLDEINSEIKRCLRDEFTLKDLVPHTADKKNNTSAEREHEGAMEDDSGVSYEPPYKQMKYSSTEDLQKSDSCPEEQKQKFDIYLLNEIYERFLEYLSKRTKCGICDYMSKRHGLSCSLFTEFLGENYFDYEKHFRTMLHAASFKHWQKLDPSDKWDIGRFFSERSVTNMADIIQTTDEYIRQKLELIDQLQKMQFEINALLRQTNVEISKPPPVQELPLELQKELLGLPEVSGCGTLFGKLTLQISADIYPSTKTMIRDLLKKHNYWHDYSTKRIDKTTELADQILRFESGVQIRAKGRQLANGQAEVNGDYKYGCLGCFVEIRELEDNDGASASYSPRGIASDYVSVGHATNRKIQHAEPYVADPSEDLEMALRGEEEMECNDTVGDAETSSEWKLHGITCAHCVTISGDQVEISSYPTFKPFGKTNMFIYDNERIDIAAIKINMDKVESCNKTMKPTESSGTLIASMPTLFDGNINELDGRHVYKWGPTTNLTHGIIISKNFRTKKMSSCEDAKFSEEFNILIDTRPDYANEHLFINVLDELLNELLKDWVTEMDSGVILDRFSEIGFLPADVISHIKEIPEKSEKNKEILEKVKERGSNGYITFKECLKVTQPRLLSKVIDIEKRLKQDYKFSEKGDSGSAVCECTIEGGSIRVISILQGCVSNKQTNAFWYSSSLKKSLNALEHKYGCEIRLATAPVEDDCENEYGLDMADNDDQQDILDSGQGPDNEVHMET